MRQRVAMILAAVILIVVTAAVASGITYMVLDNRLYTDGEMIMISREDYARFNRYARLEEIKDIVDAEYYVEPDDDAMLEGAARGMLDALGDPYTFYYSAADMDTFFNRIDDNDYLGLGMQMTVDPKDGAITVTRTFDGSPARDGGVLPGDQIVMVEDTPVTGTDMEWTRQSLTGELTDAPEGSVARFTVLRGGEAIEFSIPRSSIVTNRTEHKMLGDGIGVIHIYEFMGDSVKGFEAAVKDLQVQGMKALIIDVRGNPGGLVSDVIPIADMLVPEGLIMYTEDRFGNREEERSTRGYLDIPLVVLVNGLSASASEILTGAVQDHGVGTVIGTKTFGKGIVQSVRAFTSDGAGMQYTSSRYYTPSGRSIHMTGITPDIVVEMPEELLAKPVIKDAEDVQLQRAVEHLTEQLAS